jgi:hypothetical protein
MLPIEKNLAEIPYERVNGDSFNEDKTLIDYLIRIAREYKDKRSTTALNDPFYQTTNPCEFSLELNRKLEILSRKRLYLKPEKSGGVIDRAICFKNREQILRIIINEELTIPVQREGEISCFY